MPLSINVGLSRKASKDFQSSGVSINVTAELDQALLAKPDELQKQVGSLYDQAEQALDRQARRLASIDRDERCQHDDRGNGNGRRGASRANGGSMTDRQRRAIFAIADLIGLDPLQESRDIIGPDVDDMSIRQASELIDHLKSIESAGNGRGITRH